MRSITQRKNKKPIILATSAALILVGGAIAYIAIAHPFDNRVPADTSGARPANDVDYGPPTEADLKAAADQKDEIIKAATGGNNISTDIVVSIVGASQTGNGQPLNIRAQIQGATIGSCHVKLTRSGQPTVEKTFQVTFEATSSRCLDADVPASDFSQSGEWKLEVYVESNSKQSATVEQVVTVTK